MDGWMDGKNVFSQFKIVINSNNNNRICIAPRCREDTEALE